MLCPRHPPTKPRPRRAALRGRPLDRAALWRNNVRSEQPPRRLSLQSHFALLASYNRWMNERLYAAAGTLPAEELARDRGAFFGSIVGTLNHLVVADTIWLQRFAKLTAPPAALDPVRALPAPGRLDDMPFPEFAPLAAPPRRLDATTPPRRTTL